MNDSADSAVCSYSSTTLAGLQYTVCPFPLESLDTVSNIIGDFFSLGFSFGKVFSIKQQ